MRWSRLSSYSAVTARQYVRAVLRNIMKEYEQNMTDAPLAHAGNRWWLTSASN